MQIMNIPQKVNILEILKNKTSLSPQNYKKVIWGSTITSPLSDFVQGDLIKGEEVGSDSYISKSHKFFIRNKALQPHSFIFDFVGGSVMPILPNRFIDLNLKEGDIIISKDSNIGEVIILDKDYPNHMLSGGLIKISVEPKFYALAFLKHELFKTQLTTLASRAATIQHAKKLFLNVAVPLPPKQKANDTFEYFKLLVTAIVNKEKEIKEKQNKIYDLIKSELLDNQKPNVFHYRLPSIFDIQRSGRLDASYYSEPLMHNLFHVSNYQHEYKTLRELEYKPKRGPNLAISVIGRSIYSKIPHPNFYRLIEPMDITEYMTVAEYRWLGNKTKIPLLSKGDILFGAEGSIGKVFIFCENPNITITNYHGMAINKEGYNLYDNIFVGCFLSYLKKQGVLDKISIGGQGGSLGKEGLLDLKVPLFPQSVKEVIALLYYNPMNDRSVEKLTLTEFANADPAITEKSGIMQLDLQIKTMKITLNNVLDRIIANKPFELSVDFLKDF
jgi:hypothetical protein